jgi:hypothetical protein
MTDQLTSKPMDDVLEFLRSFISGGVNQDFKPWAGKLYQKLYNTTHETREPPHCPNCSCGLPEGSDLKHVWPPAQKAGDQRAALDVRLEGRPKKPIDPDDISMHFPEE